MGAADTVSHEDVLHHSLYLADTSLILGHRLSEWSGHGPTLEEDIAMSNLGLDLIGQARSFYSYAADVEGKGRNEDDLAYLRGSGEYLNLLMVELPKGDFAFTMVRQMLYSTYFLEYYQQLKLSEDEALSAIAAKAEKELSYHRRHSAEWVIRLGDGTKESHQRAQEALDNLWAYTGEMFAVSQIEQALIEVKIAVDPALLKSIWLDEITGFCERATLNIPENGWMQSGGKSGRHTEHLGHLLAEMQVLQRTYPGAKW